MSIDLEGQFWRQGNHNRHGGRHAALTHEAGRRGSVHERHRSVRLYVNGAQALAVTDFIRRRAAAVERHVKHVEARWEN